MNKSVDIALGLGSNLGDRQGNILRAVEMLKASGLENIQVSSLSAYAPIDCPEGSGEFLNGALTAVWTGTAPELLCVGCEIEKKLGRPQHRQINSPRPVDIDILLFGSECIFTSALIVPHERMLSRDFVMKPLAEIAGDWLVPGTSKTVAELAGEL